MLLSLNLVKYSLLNYVFLSQYFSLVFAVVNM